MAGLSLDISVSQNWFEGGYERLDSRIEFITSRTEEQFIEEIERLRKQSLQADAALFIMSAPSGMQ